MGHPFEMTKRCVSRDVSSSTQSRPSESTLTGRAESCLRDFRRTRGINKSGRYALLVEGSEVSETTV